MNDPRLDPNNPMNAPLLPDDEPGSGPTQYGPPMQPSAMPEQRPYPAFAGPIAGNTTGSSTGASNTGGRSGCTWLLGGAVGCMGLVVVMLAGVLLTGAMTVDSLLGDISGFFNFLGGRTSSAVIRVPEVDRIQLLSELTTARFSYSDVIETRVDMPPLLEALYGDSQVMVAVVRIEAGIDLEQFTAEDLQYDAAQNTLTLQLPAPRLRECFMDESQSYVVSRSTAVFAQTSTRLDSETRRIAIARFSEQALEEGILTEAEERARSVMNAFAELFVSTGTPVQQIIINFDPPNAETVLPATCR